MMKIKVKADIVIGDIAKISYHRNDLEGLAVGAVTLNNVDDLVKENIYKITGQTTTPFVPTTFQTLGKVIAEYLNDKDKLRKKQQESLNWARNFWDPKKLIWQYIDIFRKVINA